MPASPLSPSDIFKQAYTGQAETAYPYYQLSSIFQPKSGQVALGLGQQQQFGYDASTGQPLSPYGGYVGMPDGQGGYIGMTSPYGSGPYPYAAQASGGSPTMGAPASPYQAGWMTSGGGGPAMGPAAPGGYAGGTVPPGAPQLGVTGATPIGGAPVSSAPGGSGFVGYSPPQDQRIGFGQTFDNPYVGQTGPSQSAGAHPGTLSLNTTAMDAYGPAAAQGILSANPYLANALNFQTLAEADASNPLQNSQILNTLNQQAQSQLSAGGRLTPEQERANSQAALSYYTNAGAGTNSNNAIASQLFGRQNMIDQRLAAAQAMAGNVQGLNTTQQSQELQRQGLAGSLATQAAGSATSGLTMPIMNMLGLLNPNSVTDPNSSISAQNATNNPFQQIGSDVSSAIFNQQSAQNIADQNAAAANQSSWLDLVGKAIGSDERIKKGIKTVGESESGIPIKEWTYRLDPYKRKWRGAMAQDVEKVKPDAVSTDPFSGIKAVNYGKIDVNMELVSPYRKAA
jgi:hypothetical protein